MLPAGILGWWMGVGCSPVRADEFGRIVGPVLFDVPGRSNAGGAGHLGVRTIEALPEVVRGERSALIVATTDQGNLAKLLVSAGLRRHVSIGDKPAMAPLISLDRFETIDRGDRVARKARGRDVALFDGFEFDLDTGQVVPGGFGGDIAFSSKGPDGPRLIAVGRNRLYAIEKPLSTTDGGQVALRAGRPSSRPTSTVVSPSFPMARCPGLSS